MAFLGKVYKFTGQENFDAFVDSLGLPADSVDLFKKSQPSKKLVQNGDSYVLYISSSSVPDRELAFKSGVEFEEPLREIVLKSTITVNGNVVSHKQKLADLVVEYKLEFSADKLVETVTSSAWDGTAKRFYSA